MVAETTLARWRPLWITLGSLSIVGLVWVGLAAPALSLKPFSAPDVARLLATYATLALFVERTLEVFVAAQRGHTTDKLAVAAMATQRALRAAPTHSAAFTAAARTTEQLVGYRAETRVIVLRAGLGAGLLLAAAGFRTLETFVSPPAADPLAPSVLYRILDLLITGGIIGGGSEAVHRMMTVLTSRLDPAARMLRDDGARRGPVSVPPPFGEVPLAPPITPGPPPTMS
jgi:hypothetical protein